MRFKFIQKEKNQNLIKQVGVVWLTEKARQWLKNQWQYRHWFPVGRVRWGSLRRLTPINPVWPNYRGLPIDRYYIENFLDCRSDDIQGHVLEVGDASYTKKFGGDRVTQSDVLHSPIGDIGPSISIVADLTCADHIASDTFDCIILTQTLLFIYDLSAAIKTIYRILKPGGVLLLTVPGISQIIREDLEIWGEYWRFTKQSMGRLLEEVFPSQGIEIESYGNVLVATAFLFGLATQELRTSELDYHDPNYEMIITAKAVKLK